MSWHVQKPKRFSGWLFIYLLQCSYWKHAFSLIMTTLTSRDTEDNAVCLKCSEFLYLYISIYILKAVQR